MGVESSTHLSRGGSMTKVTLRSSLGSDFVNIGEEVTVEISECPVASVAFDALLHVIGGNTTDAFMAIPIRIQDGHGEISFLCPDPGTRGMSQEPIEIFVRITEPKMKVSYGSITINQDLADE